MPTRPRYAITLPDSGRRLTGDLWRTSLEAYVENNPELGIRVQDDFVRAPVALTGTTAVTTDGFWSATDSAAAGGTYTVALEAGADGIVDVGSTGTTAHFGVALHGNPVITTPNHATAAQRRGRVVFEARIDFDTADTVFLGLGEDGSNLLSATSALPADQDYAGFYTDDNGATLSFRIANDNNGGTAVTDSFTIPVADLVDGFNRLGFAINRDLSVDIAVNGKVYTRLQNGIVSGAVPIETLCVRCEATAGGGTTAPNVRLDAVDVFVEGNSV